MYNPLQDLPHENFEGDANENNRKDHLLCTNPCCFLKATEHTRKQVGSGGEWQVTWINIDNITFR